MLDKLIMIGQGNIVLLDPKKPKKNILDRETIEEYLVDILEDSPDLHNLLCRVCVKAVAPIIEAPEPKVQDLDDELLEFVEFMQMQ